MTIFIKSKILSRLKLDHAFNNIKLTHYMVNYWVLQKMFRFIRIVTDIISVGVNRLNNLGLLGIKRVLLNVNCGTFWII